MGAKIFDLYGVWEPDLTAASQRLELALGVRFSLHDSEYLGGDYYRAKHQGADIILQVNYLHFIKNWTEPEYKEFGVLLRISNASEPDVLRACLEQSGNSGTVWLRRTVVDGKKREVIRRGVN
ncbi:hypothetical protein [Archangium sp. Cb G35]|uniref:hypothetical protein n=1 Tax=Archangium sp. Cb G35 TaxID=1920190 RepID=UPI000A8DF78F|nr:hypothetical protein [Archangium sp. Cb G35]